MKRPIRPRWLLRQAGELAGGKVGQPRHTNLRRATSAAYYAVFHELALATARHLLPGSDDEEHRRASRRISHRSIRRAADWIAGDTPPKHLGDVVGRLRLNRDLTEVAQAFKELQEERESADYDHEGDFTRPGTHARIAQADRAVLLLRRKADDGDFKSFLGLIALNTSVHER